MNAKVSAFLSKHNFVQHIDIDTFSQALLSDMRKGINGEKSDEDMIRTWTNPPEAKVKNQKVIVIDAGGTNFRSCLVTFDANGVPSISNLEKTSMPGIEKELSFKEFFDKFAENLEHLKNQADSIGFCFSYPTEIQKDGDGILLGFSKEVKAPEVVGKPIGKSLADALVEHGWNRPKRVSLLNDTVAALLAGAASGAQGIEYSSYIGFILGTGMNAAYIQPAIPGSKDFGSSQIVVCESGKFCSVIQSDFDKEVDSKTTKPGTFFMEKGCSGAYLGPLSYSALTMASKEGLLSPKVAEKILALDKLTLIEASAYLEHPYDTNYVLAKILAECGTEEDYDFIFQTLDAIVERSARYSATILAACVIQSGAGTIPTKPVCILCNGSTYHKTYKIYERVKGYLEELLTRQKSLYWDIIAVENDITLGAAIGGLIER